MHLRRPGLVAAVGPFAAALVLWAGCATLPPQETEPADAAETTAPSATGSAEEEMAAEPGTGGGPAVRIHVDGPGTSPGECAVRVYALHAPDLESHVVHRTVELYRRSDDVFLVSLSGTSELPSEHSVETVDGMETPITGENLTMSCDEVRAEVLVERCEPSPCPEYAADDGYNLIPVVVKGADSE